MSTTVLVYVLTPERTALWLPDSLADLLGVAKGDQLTSDQMNHPELQRLREKRRAKEAGK